MTVVADFTARQVFASFVEWSVGTELEDEQAQRLLTGVDSLIRHGLSEQCAGWPPEWTTDGVIPFRCLRTGERTAEVVGFCWIMTAVDDPGTFPIRARLSIEPGAPRLSWFTCEVGEFDTVAARPPVLPEGSVINLDSENGPELLVGRHIRPLQWTPVISYRSDDIWP